MGPGTRYRVHVAAFQTSLPAAFQYFQLVFLGFGIGKQDTLLVQVFAHVPDPETFTLPSFVPCPLPWRQWGSCLKGLGKGLHACLKAFMERQQLRMKRRS